MELLDAINGRRSVRDYTDEAVGDGRAPRKAPIISWLA